ncbi:hypothetical protein [Burkholderia sp. WSM2230]|uniref:hypothetical protein n=1 Tax=Burkholderia sp. WSM2230 TaxID=944435 RepID=UPI0004075ACE
MYAFSNSQNGFAVNRAYSAGTTYDYGPLKVAAAYLQINGSGASNATGAADPTGFRGGLTSDLQRTAGAGKEPASLSTSDGNLLLVQL